MLCKSNSQMCEVILVQQHVFCSAPVQHHLVISYIEVSVQSVKCQCKGVLCHLVLGQWNITSMWSCSIWQHIVWNDICMTAWWYLSTNCKRRYPNTTEKCFIANIFQNIDMDKKLISELLPFAGDWTVSLGRIGLFSCLYTLCSSLKLWTSSSFKNSSCDILELQ